MTCRERLLSTVQGKPVDRVSVYTQIPYLLIAGGFKPGLFHGYHDYDNWRERDPAYWRLIRRTEVECDNFFIWRPPCMLSDPFFVPLCVTETLPSQEKDGKIVTINVLRAAGSELKTIRAIQPGTDHTWVMEHHCKGPEDAKLLLEFPWDGYSPEIGDFLQVQKWLDNYGVIWVAIPSSMLVVCQLDYSFWRSGTCNPALDVAG